MVETPVISVNSEQSSGIGGNEGIASKNFYGKQKLNNIKKSIFTCAYPDPEDMKPEDIEKLYSTKDATVAATVRRDKLKADFVKTLGVPKIGTILLLLVTSVIYTVKFINGYKPLPGQNIIPPKTLWQYTPGRAAATAVLTGGCGALSFLVLLIMRKASVTSQIANLFMIFIILFLFDLAQEASGLNRYLTKSETNKQNSIYYTLALAQKGETADMLAEEAVAESEGDPFLLSMMTLLMLLLVLAALYILFKMAKIAMCAKKYNYPVGKSLFCLFRGSEKFNSPTVLFIIELIIICGINMIPVFVNPIIRKDKVRYGATTFIMIPGIFIIQILFQFAGLTPTAADITRCSDSGAPSLTANNSDFIPNPNPGMGAAVTAAGGVPY